VQRHCLLVSIDVGIFTLHSTLQEDFTMPCLFAMVAGMFPRLGTLLLWLARPAMVNTAFGGSWLWPILGIIFLPFTTLMYIILMQGVGGLTGWDWLWMVMAVMIDVMHYSSTAYSNRSQIPGYKPTSTAPPM
jgi:hypothetical protein